MHSTLECSADHSQGSGLLPSPTPVLILCARIRALLPIHSNLVIRVLGPPSRRVSDRALPYHFSRTILVHSEMGAFGGRFGGLVLPEEIILEIKYSISIDLEKIQLLTQKFL